jgi:hypothetical protein
MNIDNDPILGSNMVFLHYVPGAGGNYIAALCALSQKCEFRHCALINYFDTAEEKYEFLLHYLRNYNNPWWEDFQMGNDRLFGVDPRDSQGLWHSLKQKDPASIYDWLRSKNTMSEYFYHSGQKFFMVSHHRAELNLYLSTWTQARVLIMVNTANWLEHRVKSRSKETAHDALTAPTIKPKFYFDTDSFLDTDKLVQEMQRVFAWLELDDFREDWIRNIHMEYLKVIDFCKKRADRPGFLIAGPGAAVGLVI